MPPRRDPLLTEADIPPPLDPPERSSFDSEAAFDEAMAEHPAAAEARMKERRRMKEKLRQQLRQQNRSKRDRSGRRCNAAARVQPRVSTSSANEKREVRMFSCGDKHHCSKTFCASLVRHEP